MRRYMFTLGAFCVLLLLSPTGQNIILAEETSQPEDYFIDLDGDGFDDNIQDGNSNNDLENSETTNKTDFKSDDDKSKLVSLDFGQSKNFEEILSNSEKFNLRKFSTRALSLSRCESGAEIGGNPGSGIGTGFINNVCIGGVCF